MTVALGLYSLSAFHAAMPVHLLEPYVGLLLLVVDVCEDVVVCWEPPPLLPLPMLFRTFMNLLFG